MADRCSRTDGPADLESAVCALHASHTGRAEYAQLSSIEYIALPIIKHLFLLPSISS